jgi:hypothetical protein
LYRIYVTNNNIGTTKHETPFYCTLQYVAITTTTTTTTDDVVTTTTTTKDGFFLVVIDR